MNDNVDPWFTGSIESRRTQTARGPVEYADIGAGPPVLYFHGNGVGFDGALMLEGMLIDDGCRLIVPNRPGYFDTPLESGRSFGDCADLAAELLNSLSIGRAIVIGTSGGGPPACQFAARHPQRTVALVMQCALSHRFDAGRWLPGGHAMLLPLFRYFWLFRPLLQMVNRQQARNPDFLAGAMSKERFAELRESRALKSLVPLLSRAMVRCAEQPAGIENDWANWTGPPWLTPGAVRCPTLILHDRADMAAGFCHAEWTQRCIPHAQLRELHAGGHMIWIGRDREKMRRERRAFIKQQLSRVG